MNVVAEEVVHNSPPATTMQRVGMLEFEKAYRPISGPVGGAIASMLGVGASQHLSSLETVLLDSFLTVNGVDGGCTEQGPGNSETTTCVRQVPHIHVCTICTVVYTNRSIFYLS